jgi:putative ABC transport system permease protein
MIGVALKGLLGRKLRTLLTAMAIVLGVSMISGTYILTDTIKASFTKVLDGSYEHADAVISGKVAFKNNDSSTATTPAFSDTVLAKVRQLPDVAAAAGTVGDQAKLIDRNGKIISTGGGSAIASSVDPRNDGQFNPLKLISGRWPVGSGQIAIDKRTSEKKHFAVGDAIGVATDDGVRQFEISGVARFAKAE